MLGALSYIFGKIADFLPGLVLRVFLSPRRISDEIDIRLSGEKPIQVSLDRNVQRIDIFFELINRSHLHLVLDRLLVDLWFGQPTLRGAILERREVPSRKSIEGVLLRYALTTSQVAQIKDYLESPDARGSIHLNVQVYFKSKVGWIRSETRIERRGI